MGRDREIEKEEKKFLNFYVTYSPPFFFFIIQ